MGKNTSPLKVSVEYRDNLYHVENKEFLLETYADSLKEAMDNIMDQVDLLYLEYCTCNLNDLTSDACMLRNSLFMYFQT